MLAFCINLFVAPKLGCWWVFTPNNELWFVVVFKLDVATPNDGVVLLVLFENKLLFWGVTKVFYLLIFPNNPLLFYEVFWPALLPNKLLLFYWTFYYAFFAAFKLSG